MKKFEDSKDFNYFYIMEGGNKIKPVHRDLELDPMTVEFLYKEKGLTQPQIIQFYVDSHKDYIEEVVGNLLTFINKNK